MSMIHGIVLIHHVGMNKYSDVEAYSNVHLEEGKNVGGCREHNCQYGN